MAKGDKFMSALEAFVDAAHALSFAWDTEELECVGYPESMPDFDSFLYEAIQWRSAVRAEREREAAATCGNQREGT